MNLTQQLWGELRSILSAEEISSVQLQITLEQWPSPYWQQPELLSYLRSHCSALNPMNEAPPLALIERWTRGHAFLLIHIYHEVLELPEVIDSQWGKSFAGMSWQVYQDGDCNTSTFDLHPQNERGITETIQWLMLNSESYSIHTSGGEPLNVDENSLTNCAVHKYFTTQQNAEVDCEFEHVTVHSGWPPLNYVQCSIQPHLISFEVLDLSDMEGASLVPWFELIFQLSQHQGTALTLAPDWESSHDILAFRNLYHRYALLRGASSIKYV